MARFAFERVDGGLPMPGLFEVNWNAPVGSVIEDILLLDDCSVEDEWANQAIYLPLKD